MTKMTIPGNALLVVNPYNNRASAKRKGLVIQGQWTENIASYIKSNEIKALYFNSAKGWVGSDYSFLAQLDTVEELNIISYAASGLRGIEGMTHLIDLSITTSTNDKIDFTRLPNLKNSYLYWWHGAASILNCANLDSLYLDGLRLKDFSRLHSLKNLNSITLANSQIDTLTWLRDFKNLQELDLSNCKKLNDFEAIFSCTTLRKLALKGCKQLKNVSFLKSLNKLEILAVSDCGELDSLSSMGELKSLKALSFAGSTRIKEGDLSVLERLPNLALLMFQDRDHYSHRLVKKWDWNNLNQPSKLLEKR